MTQTVPVSFLYDDSVTAWLDGDMFAQYSYTGITKSTRVLLSQGWHQFLFKVAEVTELNYLRIKFGSADENPDLAWQYEIPDTSSDAFLAGGGWISRLLHLGASTSERFITTNASTDYVKVGTEYKSGDSDGGLVWTPLTSSSGTWAKDTVGGDFTTYYAVAVYSALTQVITASVRHNREITGWLDGTIVIQRDGWDANHEKHSAPFEVSAGWHQFLFKLHAGDDLDWIPLKSLKEDPCLTTCREMCPSEAYCAAQPGGALKPRTDHAAPPTGLSSVLTKDFETAVNLADCSFLSAEGFTTITQSNGFVGCCNDPEKKATFAVALRGGVFTYAYEVPAHVTQPPGIQSQTTFWTSTYVELNCSTPNAEMYYTIDNETIDPADTSDTYTKKYNGYSIVIESDEMRVVLRAVAVANHIQSEVMAWTIEIPHEVYIGRRRWPASAPVAITLWGGIKTVRSVILGLESNAQAMMKLTSAPMVPNRTFSGMLPITSDGLVIVPKLDAGKYVVMYFDMDSLYSDTAKIKRINSVVNVVPLTVSARHVFVDEESVVRVNDAATSGDIMQWYNISSSDCTDDFCRTSLASDYLEVAPMQQYENSVNVLFRTVQVMSCLCYANAPDAAIVKQIATAFTTFPLIVLNTSGSGAPALPQQPAPVIAKADPDVVATGEYLTVYGSNFDPTTVINNEVVFRHLSALAAAGPTPICIVTNVSVRVIRCRITSEAGVSGRWDLAVRVGTLMSANFFAQILVVPPMPLISRAEGNCVESDGKPYSCTSGADLVFSGANFDYVTPSNNVVEFLPTKGASAQAPTCSDLKVSQYKIVCVLAFDNTVSGSFLVSMLIRLDAQLDDRYVKADVQQTITVGGSHLSAATQSGGDGSGNSDKKTGKGMIIAAAVVIGVIVLVGLIAYRYVKTRYNVVLYRRHSLEEPGIELTDADEFSIEVDELK
jgi:hypothetical protein